MDDLEIDVLDGAGFALTVVLGLVVWNLHDLHLPESIVAQHVLGVQGVVVDARQDLSPEQVVDTTDSKDTPSDHTVDVVWSGLVDGLAVGRWDVWADDKVEVDQSEEGGDDVAGSDWRVPLDGTLAFLPVDP